MGIKTLECSSRGDKRFSALYANVEMFGIKDTIENHYQKSKRNAAGGLVKKGQPVDHMVLDGHKFPASMLTSWYRLLWIQYLDNNPELVTFARQFDKFTDMFRGKHTINCQADVIAGYIADNQELMQPDLDLKGKLFCIELNKEYAAEVINLLINDLEVGRLCIEDFEPSQFARLMRLLEKKS